jgi:hypothetical protein
MRLLRCVVLAAVAAAVGIVAAGCSQLSNAPSESPPAADTADGSGAVYRNPAFGWTIRHSKHLRVGHFTARGLFTADGAWVANFDVGANGDETAASGVPNLTRLRTFPPTGVALMIWFGERLPVPPPLRDSRFPITLGTLHPITPYVGGREPTPLFRTIDGDGTGFAVAVWLGPRASADSRRAIESALASLRFPPLRTGTIYADSLYVLKPLQSYPIGSVTYVAASTLPLKPPLFTTRHGFYLVHSTHALYAIRDRFTYPGSRRTCALVYRPSSRRFACPDTSLEWNRDGSPFVSPESNAGHAPGWALGLHIATVAQDGHVLYAPFFGAVGNLPLGGNTRGS